MKISCNIIRDLLPLYLDQVCSEESKDMIENHLTECENCRDVIRRLNFLIMALSSKGSADSSGSILMSGTSADI